MNIQKLANDLYSFPNGHIAKREKEWYVVKFNDKSEVTCQLPFKTLKNAKLFVEETEKDSLTV